MRVAGWRACCVLVVAGFGSAAPADAATIAIISTDNVAKALGPQFAQLAAGIGFQTLDLGPIRFAHVVEGMCLVWSNARQSGNAFEYYFRIPAAN